MQNEVPPSPDPVVSILIVGYNSTAVIGACLSAIPSAITDTPYEVLFVDNGDGSTEGFVRQHFRDVRIVPSRGNVGFAAGNNLLAAAAQGMYLLLLNPDVEMKPKALDNLLAGARRYAEASAWGGVTLDRNDEPDLGNTVHLPSLREMASRVLGRSSARQRPSAADHTDERAGVLSGAFVMFDRTAWDEVGGLDERYFLYCEEVDLFYRLGKRDHTFWRIASARSNHDIGHGEALSARRMLYRAAGNMQFARLHWTPLQQAAAFVLTFLGAWQRVIVGRLLGRWSKHLNNVGECHSDIALRPGHWRHGYDPKRGLLARLKAND